VEIEGPRRRWCAGKKDSFLDPVHQTDNSLPKTSAAVMKVETISATEGRGGKREEGGGRRAE